MGHITNEEYYASNFNNARVEELAAQRDAAQRSIESIRDNAAVVVELLELGDQRLLAGDGPAGGSKPDLTAEEWGRVYRACRAIAKGLLTK